MIGKIDLIFNESAQFEMLGFVGLLPLFLSGLEGFDGGLLVFEGLLEGLEDLLELVFVDFDMENRIHLNIMPRWL